MDRFRELTAFAAVAEAGSFSAAARRLGVSAPAVTRLVAALEDRLAIRLFSRTTRKVALTEAGTRLFADAGRILDDLARAEAVAAGAAERPQGVLRVTAPALFGQAYLAPVLCDYLERHPQLRAELLLVDRVADLIEEGLDVALRIGDLPESGLRATRIAEVRPVVVAAPAYLTRHGTPAAPDDLDGHRIVHAAASGTAAVWEFESPAGRVSVPLTPALRVNALRAARTAAEAGWGITRLLSYQVAEALAQGRLVEVLGAAEHRRLPVHLVHAEAGRPAAKIRGFVDFAARALRPEAPHMLAMHTD